MAVEGCAGIAANDDARNAVIGRGGMILCRVRARPTVPSGAGSGGANLSFRTERPAS